MRVRLKGLNSITKRLADGREITYHYAWKGGPRLRGEPGSPEFIASYNEAHAGKVKPQAGTMMELLRYYESATEFTELGERTKQDYREKITLIEKQFGDFPLAALSDPRARGIFKEWRDELAKKSRRQADYGWVVLARVLSVAKDRGKIAVNPCEKGGRLYDDTRVDIIWTPDDEARFLANAPTHMRLPFLMALWTAQREGDLIRVPCAAYDGEKLRFVQRKSRRRKVRVEVHVGQPLKVALDQAIQGRKNALEPILLTSRGKPWTEDGFRTSWRKACANAGIVGLTFHDLRGTAVTRFALAGATEAEIAQISGHPLRAVRSILDKHYLHRDPVLGANAVRKLETRTNLPTELPTDAECSTRGTQKTE